MKYTIYSQGESSLDLIYQTLGWNKWSLIPRQFFLGLVYLSLILLFSNCQDKHSNKILESTDLVYIGDFTQGLEGPAVDKAGNLYFVNPVRNGAIGKISTFTGEFELFIDSLPNGSVANGIRFDQSGTMFLADYTNHNILTINPATKEIMTYVHDSLMNQPNDIAITSSGIIYASDPDWANEKGNIWKINNTKNVQLLASDMGTTNGIEVSMGDSILYVNESVQRRIWSYKINIDGSISNKELLFEFPDFGLDGMRSDIKGNLYVARYGKGVIAIISPTGKLINEINLKGQKPTNIAFGGKDGKTCYVTCQDRGYIEQFKSKYSGRSWYLYNKEPSAK